MALPANNIAWPPNQHIDRYNRMSHLSAWYAGDPDKLGSQYWDGTPTGTGRSDGVIKAAVGSIKRWFWGTPPEDGQKSSKLHIDLPKDLAVISSEMLFGEPVSVKVQGEEVDETREDGKTIKVPSERTKQTQERLDEILDRCNWESLLLAAAETGSALGSTGLRVVWDKDVDAEAPFLARVDADAIIPEYRYGDKLVAVTFWRQWKDKKTGTIWRHLERYERGGIYHGLYKGTDTNLGMAVPLTDQEETAWLADLVNEESMVPTPDEYRLATSIPNMLPDPLDRGNGAGRSDFTPSILSLFDAIDEVYTSLMRDIELAKGRLIVAEYMLQDNGAGKGLSMDLDQKIFNPLKMQPGENGDAPITMVQFKIRVQEHIEAAEHLAAKAVKSVGWNPQTMGDANEGGEMTATETNSRDRRSDSTTKKKRRYWTNELEQLLEGLLAIDKQEFGTDIDVLPVKIEWPQTNQPSLRALAETVELLKRAESASLKVRVETLHPDWDDQQVMDEVEELANTESVIDPNTFGLGGAGVTPDPAAPAPVEPPAEEIPGV